MAIKKRQNSVSKKAPKSFYVIMILIPVVFFALLETGLRVFNYGFDFTTFKSISNYYPDKIFLNPDVSYKYFYGIKKAPTPIPDGFDKIKKENSFRIFVLGGSSAAGWPYVPNASFSRQLKRRLELLYPDNTIEVINLGISAVNSYTIRDFISGVIEEKPDLVLIYAGHNEYYGALGVGSTFTISSSPALVNLYLKLRDFKTVQLIQNLMSGAASLFSSNVSTKENVSNETLMSRMIGESTIPYKSEKYNNGLAQIEENLNDILKRLKNENIPVIISTLTSNTRELKPFVSDSTDKKYPPAITVFNAATDSLNNGNVYYADSLFSFAKDLDALRFRAPSDINNLIRKLAETYNCPVAEVDSSFRKNSPFNIVGYNLTVDHLHPNLKGYFLMAKSFYREMQKYNYLPNGKKKNISSEKQDSLLWKNFPFTKLDSVISEMKIDRLTGEYPFVPKGTLNYKLNSLKINDYYDSLALQVINNDIEWEKAHNLIAERFYKQNNIKGFLREMNAVIEERPFYDQTYRYIANMLIDKNLTEIALPYNQKLHTLKPEYFTYKWLGQIALHNNQYNKALDYLTKASKYSEADYQTWYNLAGAYYFINKIDDALSAIEKSLKLNSKNPLAQNFYKQLKTIK